MNPASNTDARKRNAHRTPCVDGNVCGEDAHCPPASNTDAISDEAVEAARRAARRARFGCDGAETGDPFRAALEAALPFLTAEKDANTGEPSNERIPELVEGLMTQRDEALVEVEKLRVTIVSLRKGIPVAHAAGYDVGYAEGVAKYDALRVTVEALADYWDDDHVGVSHRFCPVCVRSDAFRAALAAVEGGE